MKKTIIIAMIAYLLGTNTNLSAHCQMPCGIYHDDLVYDQIDQYVETMYKGVTVLSDSAFKTKQEYNEYIRWVMLKDKASDEAAQIFLTYFLQQKIKPDESNTPERLKRIHKLLFLLVQIKQNTERALVNAFADEWEKFKLMFHVEGYECQIEMIKMRKLELEREKQQKQEQSAPADSAKKADSSKKT